MSTKANNKFQLFTFGSQNIIEGLNGVMVFVARGKIPLPQNPLSRLLVVDVRFYKVGELSRGWCFRISTSFSWGGIRTRDAFRPIAQSKYIWWIIIINVITIIIIITIIITTDKGGSYHKVYLPSDHLYQNFIKWDDLLLREVFNYNFF